MRALFLFPPRTSPTYTPLGLATLAAAVRRGVPEADSEFHDLNLTLWYELSVADADGREMLSFLSSDTAFYDESAYLARLPVRARIYAAVIDLETAAQTYVEERGLSPALAACLERMLATALRRDPELVGISVLFPEQLSFALALVKRGRETGSTARWFFGGSGLGAIEVDDLLPAFPGLDGIVWGEGEEAVLALCRGADRGQVPGLVYRDEGGGVVRNAARPVDCLGDLASPDFSDLHPNRPFNPRPVLPAVLSRNCRWRRCRFCAHNVTFGRYRRKPTAESVAELKLYIERYGCRHVYFGDQYIDETALGDLSDALVAEGLDLRFHIMARTTARYTPGLLKRAYAAGCRWISWGMESGSDRLLRLADKGTRVDIAERVIRDAHAAGISNLPMMIFGLPTGTREDFDMTCDFLVRVHPYIDAMTASSFTLFEGTPFAANPARYGLIPLARTAAFRIGGHIVRSIRHEYRRVGEEQAGPSPQGSREVAEWERRRAWLGGAPFLERLRCEHYLLYADHRAAGAGRPENPRPARRGLRPAA